LLIGLKLKESGSTHWETASGNNETGFTAVGAGMMHIVGGVPDFQYIKEQTYYWSTTELSTNDEQAMWLKLYDSGVTTTNAGVIKTSGVSVRCIKD